MGSGVMGDLYSSGIVPSTVSESNSTQCPNIGSSGIDQSIVSCTTVGLNQTGLEA